MRRATEPGRHEATRSPHAIERSGPTARAREDAAEQPVRSRIGSVVLRLVFALALLTLIFGSGCRNTVRPAQTSDGSFTVRVSVRHSHSFVALLFRVWKGTVREGMLPILCLIPKGAGQTSGASASIDDVVRTHARSGVLVVYVDFRDPRTHGPRIRAAGETAPSPSAAP